MNSMILYGRDIHPVAEWSTKLTAAEQRMNAFEAPFAIFLGDVADPLTAKTGLGLVYWRAKDCLGQIRLPGCRVDAGIPDLSVEQARTMGVRSVVVGSAMVGGQVPEHWVRSLCEAAAAGLNIVAGLHIGLGTLPGLKAAAARGGARLVDVRVPPPNIPVGTGRRRTGRRLLTVGTDCACGKKYTALALAAALSAAGRSSTFRATGQTGIMIAGGGVPIDAVIADFVTGAAEILSPDGPANHWDVVEGQGSILHPGYLPVTVGLLVGTQPDAFVVCHDPLRKTLHGWPDVPVPTPAEIIERTVAIGKLTNREIRCVGISANTSKVPAGDRPSLMERLASETGVPCVDPLVGGVQPVVERLLQEFPSS